MAEYVRECVWNDAPGLWVFRVASHRVGLSRARLAIGQDCAVVALEYFVDDGTGRVQVDVDLQLNGAKYGRDSIN